jgi:probable F420-dependent oxidoreductase
MKVSFFPSRFHELPGGQISQCIDLARMAEDAGLYSIHLGDHVVMGTRTDRYPYGAYRHEIECAWLEPIATLSAFAAVTSTIRLSAGVILAPLRPATLLAKQLASLDQLSDGRCEPGLGVGWQREEYLAQRLDWPTRHTLFEETIAACRALWGEQPASFAGELVRFEEVYSFPRPLQARLPVLCGVRADARNCEMIAALGDGWTPVGGPDVVRAGSKLLREAFVRAGRDPGELIVRASLPTVMDEHGSIDVRGTLDQAVEFEDAGATVFSVRLPVGYGEMFRSMKDLGAFIETIGREAQR